MEVFVAIECVTFNELGAVGGLSECEIFKTEVEAVEYVVKKSGGKEPKKEKNRGTYLYSLSFDTEYDHDEIRWYILKRQL